MKIDRQSEKDKKSKEKGKYDNSHDELFDSKVMNGKLQESFSGRSDVGIQTEIHSATLSSTEFAERMMKQDQEDDDDDEPAEGHKLLPKRVSLSSATKRRGTHEISLTESEKLKLLLLPSK